MRQAIIAAIVVAFAASQASAADVDRLAWYIRYGYCQNADWPWPYVCPDRIAARDPFNLMVTNGWQRQNLLGAHHFTDDGGRLTTAGELKVRWIMTQAPPAHRDVFVERSIDPAVTAHRVAAARQYAEKVAINGQRPVVEETYLISEGRPASMVDAVNTRFEESMPPPVLPASTGTGTDGLTQ
jgi:hypothetical protein